MLANEGAITGGLVKNVRLPDPGDQKDFWNLWNSGGDADVVLGWTATSVRQRNHHQCAQPHLDGGIVVGYELA